LAGLYEWRPQAQPNEPRATFTILTTDANGTVEPIHDRMPVLLDGDAVDAWIDPSNPNPAALRSLLVPAPDDLLIITPASRRINRAGTDGDPTLLRADEQGALAVE
jgi:putative SOS response-associated peptidase YedK